MKEKPMRRFKISYPQEILKRGRRAMNDLHIKPREWEEDDLSILATQD